MDKNIGLGAGKALKDMTEEEAAALLNQASSWEAYRREMGKMEQIAAAMKEIPVLTSDKPKDVNPLIKVEFPEEGGILTYMAKYERPFRGFPYHEFVDRIDMMKKIIRSFLSGIHQELRGCGKVKLLSLIPAAWLSRSLLRAGAYSCSRIVERFRIKTLRYSEAVRELHRALSIEREWENQRDRTMRHSVRDALCMILEFDNAYRFRLQDIIPEYRKGEPLRKELIRLIDLIVSREKEQQVKDTWSLVRIFVLFYLPFDRKLLRLIEETLNDLDMSKISLSLDDAQYCLARKDYVFGIAQGEIKPEIRHFMALNEIEDLYAKEKEEILSESTKEHEELSKIHSSSALTEEEKKAEMSALDEKHGKRLAESERKYRESKELLNKL